MTLPPIDAHAHIEVRIAPHELDLLNAFVMAVTGSLNEAEAAATRRDHMTLWGVGCHPAVPASVGDFDRERFAAVVHRSPFVGEVGLDRRSKVPMERQVDILGEILDVVAQSPRPVSLHSTGATAAILDVLERHPVPSPILHWWRGTRAETDRAVELGCLFSLNGHEARSPKVIEFVPVDRVLPETDFPHTRRYDPDASRPGAVATVEHMLAAHYQLTQEAMRERTWSTLARLLAGVPENLLSDDLANALKEAPLTA